MNNQIILLIIGVIILLITINIIGNGSICSIENGEKFSYITYNSENVNTENNKINSVVDDEIKFNDDRSFSCVPEDGRWSIPNSDELGRSKLNSKCCQPPDYKLGNEKNYKTCNDILNINNPIEKCINDCCKFVESEEKKGDLSQYDSSWFPMAKCACSLWCNNQDVIHFKKYGTAVHYISGDIAEAQTSDTGNFIGVNDFSGK
jgi:hypothetical protein